MSPLVSRLNPFGARSIRFGGTPAFQAISSHFSAKVMEASHVRWGSWPVRTRLAAAPLLTKRIAFASLASPRRSNRSLAPLESAKRDPITTTASKGSLHLNTFPPNISCRHNVGAGTVPAFYNYPVFLSKKQFLYFVFCVSLLSTFTNHLCLIGTK